MLGIDLDIELGNTEEELKDDPGKTKLLLVLPNDFQYSVNCAVCRYIHKALGNTMATLHICTFPVIYLTGISSY